MPSFLDSGIWQSYSLDNTAIFDSTNTKVQIFSPAQSLPSGCIADYEADYTGLKSESVNGFFKMTLADSFGYNEYIKDLSLSLIEKVPTVTKTISNTPIEPYSPKIKSIYASYSAYCTNDLSAATASVFESREISFFHLYPFGDGEQHKYLNPAENVYLLPQFKHTTESETKSHIGEFYIGIENLNPNEGVNILFQVMEGTTNPTIAKPTEHLSWAFLSNNKWIEFQSSDYSDNTLQLVQSGIISFAIPAEATTTNTILPAGYIWLRASVTEAAEAVCDLISVDAQASVATFVNNENADDFLNTALPAGTVRDAFS